MPRILPRDNLIEIAFPPILWILFFVAAYVTIGAGCTRGLSQVEVFGMNGVRGVVVLLGAFVALLLLVGGAVLFLRARRGKRHAMQVARAAGDEKEREPRKHRRYFLALCALCLTGMMLLGIGWVLFAASLVQVC